MSLHTILRQTAGDIPEEEFRTSRSYRVARVRHHAFFRAMTETGLTIGQIANAAGVPKASVVYGAAAHAIRTNKPIPRGASYRWHHIAKLRK